MKIQNNVNQNSNPAFGAFYAKTGSVVHDAVDVACTRSYIRSQVGITMNDMALCDTLPENQRESFLNFLLKMAKKLTPEDIAGKTQEEIQKIASLSAETFEKWRKAADAIISAKKQIGTAESEILKMIKIQTEANEAR